MLIQTYYTRVSLNKSLLVDRKLVYSFNSQPLIVYQYNIDGHDTTRVCLDERAKVVLSIDAASEQLGLA